jgi:activator of 2-hydroxyglutaryl-CoA dehydratase
VFTGTEIIQHIRSGRDVRGIIRGVYTSVVKRLLEMAPIDEPALLTGGAVANNPALVDVFRERLPAGVDVPELPQLVGAVGAGVYAWDAHFRATSGGGR